MSRSDCFRLERQLAGRASHPLGASALARRTIFRKVTNGTPSEWGAEFFAAVRSVIGTGRLNGLSPFDAIAMTIDGRSILNPT